MGSKRFAMEGSAKTAKANAPAGTRTITPVRHTTAILTLRSDRPAKRSVTVLFWHNLEAHARHFRQSLLHILTPGYPTGQANSPRTRLCPSGMAQLTRTTHSLL